MIGAGIVTYVGIAVGYTGRAAWIAYATAVLGGFLVNLPLILMCTAARIKGGNYSFMSTTCGDILGGFCGISQLVSVLVFSNFALALASYLTVVFPSVPSWVFAYGILTLFAVVNLFGTDFMAKVQNILSVILILGLVLLGFTGIANARPDWLHITQDGYFSDGLGGFNLAVMALMGSTQGYTLITSFSGSCKRPKRDLPLALCGVPLVLLVIYCSVGIAMSNVLPVEETANQPLTAVAKVLFPNWLYYVFIFAGPVMALATTMNSSFGIFERPLCQVTDDGWLPQTLSKRNKYGIAWKWIIIMYIVGIIPMASGLSIATILANTTFLSSITNILLVIGIWRYPETMEGAWENRSWKVSMAFFKGSCVVCLLIRLFLIWQSLKKANMTMVIGSTIALIVCLGWCYYRQKSGKVHVTKSWELQ